MEHAADINAITNYGHTVFSFACEHMSFSFVEELAGKVAPDHLALPNNYDLSPMRGAFVRNADLGGYLPIVRLLILRGVPVRPQDFPATFYSNDLLPRRRQIVASIDADLTLNDHTWIGQVLAGGVHAPYNPPTYTTTTTTATTKRVRTQQPDGSWSAPVSVPCEPRLVVTAAPTFRRSTRTAAPAPLENHLPKLRGFRNSEVRMEIAGYLGVRPAAELGLLRAARDVLAALPEESDEE